MESSAIEYCAGCRQKVLRKFHGSYETQKGLGTVKYFPSNQMVTKGVEPLDMAQAHWCCLYDWRLGRKQVSQDMLTEGHSPACLSHCRPAFVRQITNFDDCEPICKTRLVTYYMRYFLKSIFY